MEEVKRISQQVEQWIREEELPVRATFKVERQFDDLFDEDCLSYGEAYAWAMWREHGLILSIPQPKQVECWPPIEPDGDETLSFAFGSYDYQSQMPEFSKYHYRIRKVYERVFDLATTYATLSNWQGKVNTFAKYKALIDSLGKNKTVVIKCESIWSEHAYD